ncbi:MAG TPA: ATP-binding cassette domain-containing protein, partial [Burkholderiales bacterium]|nr:ATP-binding cassette domain-containing protein [Burkholderiales bacterium]
MKLQVEVHKVLRSGDRQFRLDARFHAEHDRVVVFGPSGSGKSITMQCIAGLLRPDAGRIVVNERVLFDSAAGIDL